MLEIGLNNLFVLCIYCLAGQLVLLVTGSKLAPLAPWSVFAIHMIQTGVIFFESIRWLGLLPCLALVLPHAWLEITGLVMGCIVGTKLCKGQKPVVLLAVAAIFVCVGAYVETYITPFPFDGWL